MEIVWYNTEERCRGPRVLADPYTTITWQAMTCYGDSALPSEWMVPKVTYHLIYDRAYRKLMASAKMFSAKRALAAFIWFTGSVQMSFSMLLREITLALVPHQADRSINAVVGRAFRGLRS